MSALTKKDLISRIDERRSNLQEVSRQLKEHFVGLDNIIDQIIRNIEIWYIMPELLTRPIIINLWGLTGVGKTDLVRRLVRGLNFSDNFVEIQLTNKGAITEGYSSNVQSILSYSNLETNTPGILLLDEIQRFRSVDEGGGEIHDYKFQDVWTLLSDGCFGGEADSKDRILQIIYESMYWDDYTAYHGEDEEDEAEPDEATAAIESIGESPTPKKKRRRKKKKKVVRKYQQTYFDAKRLKKMLKLDEPIEEIMSWDKLKQNELLVKKLDDPDIHEGENYSKLLIFVSGNLDEAYGMADHCEDIDIDADVFYEHSLNINLITIKRALKERFKPEQIARLGNTHVIYPSLSSTSYVEIMRRKIKDLVDSVYEKYSISIEVDASIFDIIYRNGVFPVQGTRPLFSTISSILENSLPFFLFNAISKGVDSFAVSYKDKHIISEISGKIFKIKYEGDIDKIHKGKNDDQLVNISVHEAGHAVVYAISFALAPLQITSKTAGLDHGGFVGSHTMMESYERCVKMLRVSLAGSVAEEVVFGDINVTSGSTEDIKMATILAGKMIREWGFPVYNSTIMPEESIPMDYHSLSFVNFDTKESNKIIEKFIKEQRQVVHQLLSENLAFLKAISDKLIVNGIIEQGQFKEICEEFDLSVEIVEARELVCSGYQDAYNSFFLKDKEFISLESTRQKIKG